MKSAKVLSRRRALLGMGASAAALPLLNMLGCESGQDDLDGELLGDPGDGGSDAGSTTRADPSSSIDASTDAAASTSSDAGVLTGWATGGVAAKASYAL
jgi:hypothetical protein